MGLVDTHCHIHDSDFFGIEREAVYQRAIDAEIQMICVGTSGQSSKDAVAFTDEHHSTWAVVGAHPHEANDSNQAIGELLHNGNKKIVGVGEIGLDYFYFNAPREAQIASLEQQLQWARDYHLPVSFHVRDYKDPSKRSVWEDFWPIFDNFSGIKGVLHSFTDTRENLGKALSRDLLIGVNGIVTFSPDRQEVYRQIPLEKIVLETDAPFLTPKPFRGKMNEPKYVERVAAHVATLHGVSFDDVARSTNDSARRLFAI